MLQRRGLTFVCSRDWKFILRNGHLQATLGLVRLPRRAFFYMTKRMKRFRLRWQMNDRNYIVLNLKAVSNRVRKYVKLSKNPNSRNVRECLLNKGKRKRFMTQRRSKNHQNVVSPVWKVGLSSYVDKLYPFKDGIHLLAYGHYKIKWQRSSNG